MFETLSQNGNDTIISNGTFEVRIIPKIYDDGYTLTKVVKDKPLEIVEVRDIRLPLSESEILKEAKKLLKQIYESVDLGHFTLSQA
ncbi:MULTISPECIES: hypothetical protein [Eubacterium]|uniref:Uncharacterized protein n=2 Tax=Eubacterium TaxID=1730 RepID=A0A1H4B4B3_9FIRM|nr:MULTISPECIES: hypothetical protein [Eubacterium]MDD4690669.1 hypothetical protein [Eubacterium aggregans]MEA5073443.1 hypothetical protein [Eubacterium aggregans]SDX39909.1 hypothetical protein SAMN04488579_10234 [Eubacterium barkeri]SEA42896.1 hypothetical protein SAMN04515656_11025 [Eubacterium aggregans]